MITGHRAFDGENSILTLAAILHNEPRRVRELAHGAPKKLEEIVERCLRKDPARRFQSMTEVKTALDTLNPARRSLNPFFPRIQWKAVSRPRALEAAVIALVLVAAIAAGFVFRSKL